jgi:copper(I)-binding protein
VTPRRVRRLAAPAVLVVATVALSGCGAGNEVQTNQQYQAAIGANLRTGEVQLFNALAVDNGNGTATVSTVIVNTTDQDQKLGSATATTLDGTTVPVESATATVPANGTFNTGTDATVVLKSKDVKAGGYVELTLSFDGAGDVRIEAPVVARTDMYSGVAEKATADSAS